MSICDELIETCTVQFDIDDSYIIIIGIYRTHFAIIFEFTEQLDGTCYLPFAQKCKILILAGDFNINILDSSNLLVSNLMSTLQSLLSNYKKSHNNSISYMPRPHIDAHNNTSKVWCDLL